MDLLVQRVFGRSSEKLDANQLDLFLLAPENEPGKVDASSLEEASLAVSRPRPNQSDARLVDIPEPWPREPPDKCGYRKRSYAEQGKRRCKPARRSNAKHGQQATRCQIIARSSDLRTETERGRIQKALEGCPILRMTGADHFWPMPIDHILPTAQHGQPEQKRSNCSERSNRQRRSAPACRRTICHNHPRSLSVFDAARALERRGRILR